MTPPVTATEDAWLDDLQRAAFDYFLQAVNPANGLIADTSRAKSPCSIATVGFALSAYPVAVERGWMTRTMRSRARSSPCVSFTTASRAKPRKRPAAFAHDGIEVRLNTMAVGVRVENGEKLVDLVSDDYQTTVAADAILTGVGRVPDIERLDLEAAGVDYDKESGIRIDDLLRTSNRRIYAAGDVCLEHKFTHTADTSARIAGRNALFPGRQRLSALTIPWCTCTNPAIAHVGLYVRRAHERDISIKTFTIPLHNVDPAIADSEETGFVKIHIREGSDGTLGATIVARHAGEMTNEITLAMVTSVGLRALGRVIHAYPTQADAIKQAADACNRTRLTLLVRALLRRWLWP